nr:PGF-pre-PGF domain-containing protein [uncultured Methanolobus sp.]
MIKTIMKLSVLSALAILSLVLFITPALAAGEIAGTRSLSDTSVEVGDTVTVTVSMYILSDVIGPAIEESVPEGWNFTVKDKGGMNFNSLFTQFTYPGSLSNGDSKAVVYELTIPQGIDDGVYDITGVFTALNGTGGQYITPITIEGDTQITVGEGSSSNSALRTISADTVKAGDSFNVTIWFTANQADSTTITENVPSGWTLNEVDNDGWTVTNSDNSIEWTNTGVEAGTTSTIIYEVTVPSQTTAGQYEIAGSVDGSQGDIDIEGDSSITVTTASSSTPTSSGSSGSGGGGGGGGGSTGEEYENIAKKEVESVFINKGSDAKYEFDSEENAITFVQFNALKNSGQISTTIEVLKDRSTFVTSGAPGLVYQYMSIWVGKAGFATSDNIESPAIGFRVEKDWMEENSVTSGDMNLYRYSDDSWNKLETEIVSDDGNYVYFESQTPGFSPFAISASVTNSGSTGSGTDDRLASVQDEQESEATGDESSQEEQTASIPAVGLTGSLFVLAVAGLFVERRRSK